MTNEEKARILSNKGCLGAYISKEAEALNPTEEDKQRLSLYGACLEAMQWKDEQHKQEKQQWIDKACEWWTNNWRKYVMTDKDGIVALCFWKNDFKQAMKGEQQL